MLLPVLVMVLLLPVLVMVLLVLVLVLVLLLPVLVMVLPVLVMVLPVLVMDLTFCLSANQKTIPLLFFRSFLSYYVISPQNQVSLVVNVRCVDVFPA